MESTGNFYWSAVIVSNGIALLLLYLSWKRPLIARLGILTLLAWAGFANWMMTTSIFGHFPADANITFSIIDAGPAHHWFANHGSTAIRSIASCQWLIALSLLMPPNIRKAGAFAGIFLLFLIAPIGFGTPFPFTFLIAVALYAITTENKAKERKAEGFAQELQPGNHD